MRASPDSHSAFVILLYPIWGLLFSALEFNSPLMWAHSIVLTILVGVAGAGLLPFALHTHAALKGNESFSWSTAVVCLSFGGVVALFLGSILQALLLWIGITHVFGLPINTWGWTFPNWMYSGV